MSNIDFDHLFALRVLLQDDYENENDIINGLAIELMNNGATVEQVPNILKEFYEKFGINLSDTTISSVTNRINVLRPIDTLGNIINIPQITSNIVFSPDEFIFPIVQPYDSDLESSDSDITDDTDISNNTFDNNFEPFRNVNTILSAFMNSGIPVNISSLLNGNSLPRGFNHFQDVKTTLQEEEINKIKKYETEKNLEEKCSVCLTDIEAKQIVSELPCLHTFHTECIEPWLKEYNYKCPVCRQEVGKPKHNI